MNKTSISDLKAKAKDQLLGNYGIAAGSFALIFALIYVIMLIIMIPYTGAIAANSVRTGPPGVPTQIMSQLIGMVIGAISVTFSVGYMYILYRISKGEKPVLSDLFFVFKNHPDKVLIICFVLLIAQFVLLLPSTLVMPAEQGQINGKAFLLYIVLYLIGFVISFIIDLMLAMSYLIYIEDPDRPVMEMIKGSVVMMRGNKFRYFYMLLSFIGYAFLVVLSLGIAILWVAPYQSMTMIEFYSDLKGEA